MNTVGVTSGELPRRQAGRAWQFLLFILFAVTATAQTTDGNLSLTAAERTWIAAHPVIRVGIDPEWPPFTSRGPEGTWQGIDVDFLALLSRRTGIKFTIVETANWKETVGKFIAGEIDMGAGTARSPERQQVALFSAAYCEFPAAFITRSSGPFLAGYLDLPRMRVAAPASHITTVQIQNDFPEARLDLVTTAEEALRKVAAGEAEVAIANLAVASHVIHHRGLANLKISGFMPYEFPLRYAVQKHLPELAGILDKAIASIPPLEREAVFANWILPATQTAARWHWWRRVTLYIAGSAAVLLAVVLLANWRMGGEISARRRAETELRSAHTELQTLHNEKTWLLNVVSHDLKNGVQTISMGTEIIQTKPAGRDPSLQLAMQSIGDAALRMDRLVKNVLNSNAIEHGKVTVQSAPLDAIPVVREVIDHHRSVLELKQAQLVTDLPAQALLLGDRTAVAEILENLLSNAVRVTNPGGTVTLTVGRRAGNVRFTIRDEGPGLEPQEAASLLKLQSQAPEKLTTGNGSTGLGLRIVRYFVQQMRGKVWCESEPGQGATFFVEIPEAP